MAAMTLDTIMIKIESDASKATGNIDKLSESLSKLRSSMKGGFNHLRTLGDSLEKLERVSQKIPSITKNLNNMSGFTSAMNSFSDISNPKGLTKVVSNLEKLPKVMSKITPKSLQNIERVSRQLADALTPLADKLATIAEGFSAISQLADKYGVSVTKVNEHNKQAFKSTSQLSDTLKGALSKGLKLFAKNSLTISKNVVKSFSNIHSKIKQVGLSLLGTRTLFTAVRKAVSEYMAMDKELTNSITNSWRAFGAQLAPAVEYAIHLFTQLMRVIYSVIKALFNVDLIARANAKAMASWALSSKETLGNLQKFDDLNVADFSKNNDENKLIDLEEIDLSPIQKVIDWVRKLKQEIKDAWSSGEWYGVGETLAEGLNGAIGAINIASLSNKLSKAASNFGDLLQGFIDKTEWTTVGTKLTEVLKLIPDTITKFLNEVPWEDVGKSLGEFLSTFRFDEIIMSLNNAFTTAVVNILDVLSTQDWETIGTRLYNVLANVFSNFDKILNAIPWEGIATAIRVALSKINWGKVIEKALATFFSTFAEILAGLTGTTKDEAAKWTLPVMALLPVLGLLIGLLPKVLSSVNDLDKDTKGFADTAASVKKALNLATIIVVLGGLILLLQEVGSLIQTFADSGKSASEVLGFLATIVGSIVVLIGALTAAAFVLGKSPDAMVGLILITVALNATLMNLAIVIPILLASFAYFIKTVAPPIIEILNTIFNGLEKIIKALGETLPPVLTTVGNLFDSIFNGIGYVVETIGKTILAVLDGMVKLVERVFDAIINFINKLGPAINNFVDNMIRAITRLVNFVVSGIEFMVNGIISAINGLSSGLRKIGNKLFNLIGVDVQFNPISKVYLDRFAPKLSTGTNNIPYEGIYHLHPGEAVVPKKYNPALGNGGSEETTQKLDTLISLMENMNFTNIVNVGNATLYKGQQAYNKMQNDKYGTTVNI